MNHSTNNLFFANVRCLGACLLLASLSLTGCGTSSYGDAVKKSTPELTRRGKFAALGPDYVRLPSFPIAFRVPKMFLEDDQVNKRWRAADGKPVLLSSKDPFELKNDPNFRGGIQPDFAIPRELQNPIMNPAHQGTYHCEYKVTVYSDPSNLNSGTDSYQSMLMSIWVFDASAQSKLKPPSEQSLLAMVKGQGKTPPRSTGWEDDLIDTISTPENPTPASIPAKIARFPVTSRFMVGRDNNRILTEKKGLLRLWSFRLENKYQVFVAMRIASDLAEGETPEFPQDPENPEADRLRDLGRAVIGTMSVVPEAPVEAEAKKK
jgi:hypothetical protein